MVKPTIKPPVMGMSDGAAYLGGRSESTVRDLLAQGKIRAVRDGKRRLLVTESLDEYLAALPPADDVKPTHPKRFNRSA